MTRRLQVTLYVVSAYLTLFGALFLFAPGVFERFAHTTLPDPVLTPLYGQHTLTFAFVAFMAGREKERAGPLSLTTLVLTAGHVVIFGYLLLNGLRDFAQAGPPLIVNAILMVLLFAFRR